jgi:hypothetical protein
LQSQSFKSPQIMYFLSNQLKKEVKKNANWILRKMQEKHRNKGRKKDKDS